VGTFSGDDGQPRPDTPRPFKTQIPSLDILLIQVFLVGIYLGVHGKEKVYGSIP